MAVAAPCNRLIVRNTSNKTLASLERDLGFRKCGNVHDILTFARLDGRLPHNSEIVCRAIISSSSVGTT